MTNGLCMRLPVGRPLAASRGLTISCEVAMTMIVFSRPFWVTEPLISPCFCPFSRMYALRAMLIRPLPSVTRRLVSVYAPLRAGRQLTPAGVDVQEARASPAPPMWGSRRNDA